MQGTQETWVKDPLPVQGTQETWVKDPPASAGHARDVGSTLGWEDALEKEMATHSSILAW